MGWGLNLASAKTQPVIPEMLELVLKHPVIPERTAARKQDSAFAEMPSSAAPIHKLLVSASAMTKQLSTL